MANARPASRAACETASSLRCTAATDDDRYTSGTITMTATNTNSMIAVPRVVVAAPHGVGSFSADERTSRCSGMSTGASSARTVPVQCTVVTGRPDRRVDTGPARAGDVGAAEAVADQLLGTGGTRRGDTPAAAA